MPVSKGQNVAGKVLFDLDPLRHEHLVLDPDAHETFIKGPVAEAAEGKAVYRPVIMSFAPRLDVCRFNDGMAVRSEHPDAAQSATVFI